jgi:hypothetical protein
VSLAVTLKLKNLHIQRSTVLPQFPLTKIICADAIKTLVDEDRDKAGHERYSLAGELVWSLLHLVDLQLAGQRSVRPLLELIEAGFRGAACSIEQRNVPVAVEIGRQASIASGH